jgi:hypothetical protein
MNFDFNVDNYTIKELLVILGYPPETIDNNQLPSTDDIIQNTNKNIKFYKQENKNNIANFFADVQTKLLQFLQDENDNFEDFYEPNEQQTNNWYENQVLPQENNDIQKNKITDREQKIDVYDNNHVPMKQEQLGVSNTFQVPVAQDKLNPNLENITSRFINLDSQFRQASGGVESISTDYTLDLSDPLTNVLSLRLYSIQIPYTWYTIDTVYGNTCFWITNKGNSFKISIEPGNYSPSEFCNFLNTKSLFTSFLYQGSVVPTPNIVRYNSNNGKITIQLNTDWLDPSGNTLNSITQYVQSFDASENAYFTFFDITGAKSCFDESSSSTQQQNHSFDGTLGWLMGYRLPIIPIFQDGNVSQSMLNLFGTKYFIVVLDDYNQNHINNGLVSIAELSKILPLPSYYNNSQPYICTPPGITSTIDINAIGNLANLSANQLTAQGLNAENLFNALLDKVDVGTGNVQQILPSAPRTLTQAQIYTINEIMKNRNKTISFRSKAPTNSDTFAIIPIKYGSMSVGQLYTELSGQFQDNKRVYFGPVDIDRMRLRLLDDKGNVVDLHGADWCISMISENLYQY